MASEKDKSRKAKPSKRITNTPIVEYRFKAPENLKTVDQLFDRLFDDYFNKHK